MAARACVCVCAHVFVGADKHAYKNSHTSNRLQMDPESDGPLLPTQGEEYRPFQRRLPEFKFWYQCSKVN